VSHAERLAKLLASYPDERILASSLDGKMVVTEELRGPDFPIVTRIRELPRGRIIQRFPDNRYIAKIARLSPDGSLIALQTRGGRSEGNLFLWEVGRRRMRGPLKSDVVFPLSMAFSPDGAALAECGLYGDMQVWSVATGRTLKQWRAL
jgi:hypothetical protein